MPTPLENKAKARPKRNLDVELDRLESKIGELRMLFEQFFVDVLPHPPEKPQKEVVMMIKGLLKAPFKNAEARFRLRMLTQRYQTYHTYWERVLKAREEGTYHRDVFKAELREKLSDEARKDATRSGASDKGFQQLYKSYETALQKAGVATGQMNFEAFKSSLVKKAKTIQDQHGVKKLTYKVVVKNGKVVIKASPKVPPK